MLSKESWIQTVLAETPHGCSVTPSPWNAVAATPMHRPLFTPNGAYSISNALRSGKPCAPPPKWRLTAEDTRPAAKKSDTRPWKDWTQSRAGSELLDLNRMIGWPTFSLCRNTSIGDAGPLDFPPVKFGGAKSLLKVLTQPGPHDGVPAAAGPAVSAPAMPTPPTRVSVAAAASTLLLMDINVPLLEPTAVPCARLSELTPAAREDRTHPTRSARCRL